MEQTIEKCFICNASIVPINKCTQYIMIKKKYEKKINHMEHYMKFYLSKIIENIHKHSIDRYIIEFKYDFDKIINNMHDKNIEENCNKMIESLLEEIINKMFDNLIDDIIDDLKYRIKLLKEEMQDKYLLKFLGDSSDSLILILKMI